MQLEICRLLYIYNLLNTGSQTLINDHLSPSSCFWYAKNYSEIPCTLLYLILLEKKTLLISTDNLQYLGYAWMIEAINKYWYVGSEFLI